jgi:hypothetical protein
VNLQEVLDPLDVFRRATGIRLQDIYNIVLARGWTLGSAHLLRCMHGVIRLYHGAQVKLLARFWEEQRPEMVVSLVPNFNRALFESLQRALPGTPLVTVLTDLADYPPHFWIENQKQYLICGTERAVAQAKSMGFEAEHVFRTSGMVLRPEFYSQPAIARREKREKLGLDPDRSTGLVLFGSQGSKSMISIAEKLGNSSTDLQLIMMCGRNNLLRERLAKLRTRNPILLEGFTREIPRYMQLADFFIGKPGPGCISEALNMGLPVIVTSNAWTLPQERYNAQWIAEQGLGMVIRSFREIERAVRELLRAGTLEGIRQRIRKMENRAVFEIQPILERILETQKPLA